MCYRIVYAKKSICEANKQRLGGVLCEKTYVKRASECTVETIRSDRRPTMEIKSVRKQFRMSQNLVFRTKALTHKLFEVRCEVEE